VGQSKPAPESETAKVVCPAGSSLERGRCVTPSTPASASNTGHRGERVGLVPDESEERDCSPPVLGEEMRCEQAVKAYLDNLGKAARCLGSKPSWGANAAVVGNGSYIISCGAPMSMTVRVCAAVQNGRAVGVTVTTDPPNKGIAACVVNRVGGMSFPSRPTLDVTKTVFAGQ
jgi:hypothetical protein